MRHGRPDERDLCTVGGSTGFPMYVDIRARGWRRQHAQCVWNAAMAVLMALTVEQLTVYYHLNGDASDVFEIVKERGGLT